MEYDKLWFPHQGDLKTPPMPLSCPPDHELFGLVMWLVPWDQITKNLLRRHNLQRQLQLGSNV